MNSAVVSTPSAYIIWYLWPSTVRVDSPSATAISFMVRPLADEPQHLALPGREPVAEGPRPREEREDIRREARRQVGPAPEHLVNRGDEVPRQRPPSP